MKAMYFDAAAELRYQRQDRPLAMAPSQSGKKRGAMMWRVFATATGDFLLIRVIFSAASASSNSALIFSASWLELNDLIDLPR